MKQSMRAKRMARHHKRLSSQGKLSLVSLMDIFTILVFFLMLNASDVQVLQNDRSLTLPKSSTDTAAEEQLLLTINAQRLMLDGKLIMSLDAIVADQDGELDSLASELAFRKSLRLDVDASSDEETQAQSITIMGDHEIEYKVLKKIMQTCASQGFTNISLAVEYVEPEESASVEGAI